MRRLIGAALTLGLVASLTGCGGGSDDDVEIRDRDTSTASSDAPEAESADEAGATVTLASAPDGLDETADSVVDSYLRYWKFRVASYAAASLDPAALGSVASGQPAVDIQRYVAELAANGERTEGPSTLTVSDVVVTGDVAQVTACLDDRTVNVSVETGEPVEQPAGRLGFAATLNRAGPDWIVSRHERTEGC